jgi:hypothetical protein
MKLGLQIYAIIIPIENSYVTFSKTACVKKKSLFGSFGCLLAKI